MMDEDLKHWIKMYFLDILLGMVFWGLVFWLYVLLSTL